MAQLKGIAREPRQVSGLLHSLNTNMQFIMPGTRSDWGDTADSSHTSAYLAKALRLMIAVEPRYSCGCKTLLHLLWRMPWPAGATRLAPLSSATMT